jgi:hypothetical protein
LYNPNLFLKKFMIQIQHKKGNPHVLTGLLVAYVHIQEVPGEAPSPLLDGMVRNGILAITGDFRNSETLRDFIQKEFKGEIDQGLSELLDQLKEAGLADRDASADNMKEKLNSMASMEIIPVPARVVFFDSEESLLESEGDVFYLGSFKTANNAHLAITSFPIMYQAMFREQQHGRIQDEINRLLNTLSKEPDSIAELGDKTPERPKPLNLPIGGINQVKGDLEDFLRHSVLDRLLSDVQFNGHHRASEQFTGFMQGFRYPQEVELFIRELKATGPQGTPCYAERKEKLELMCAKFAALHNEEFEKAKLIQEKLKEPSDGCF